jgi:hypothetical protein
LKDSEAAHMAGTQQVGIKADTQGEGGNKQAAKWCNRFGTELNKLQMDAFREFGHVGESAMTERRSLLSQTPGARMVSSVSCLSATMPQT